MNKEAQNNLQGVLEDLDVILARLDDEYDGLNSKSTPPGIFEALENAGYSIVEVVSYIRVAKRLLRQEVTHG